MARQVALSERDERAEAQARPDAHRQQQCQSEPGAVCYREQHQRRQQQAERQPHSSPVPETVGQTAAEKRAERAGGVVHAQKSAAEGFRLAVDGRQIEHSERVDAAVDDRAGEHERAEFGELAPEK